MRLFPQLIIPAILAFSSPGPIGYAQATSPTEDSPKPNIIVILADDLGYGDVGCYGAKTIPTPNIDRLASQGVRFTSGYCSASTCTPTRYSLLTGKYAFRQKGTGVAPPNSPSIIPAGTPTVASMLRSAGYTTAAIGKWHLGLGGPQGPDWNGSLRPGPLDFGFDHCFLMPTTNDRVPQVLVNDDRVLNLDPSDPLWVGEKKPSEDHPTGQTHRGELKMNWSHGHNATIHNGVSRIGFYTGGNKARFRDEDLSDRWVQEADRWIRANREKPFFLYFCSHAIHVPRVVHERFSGVTPHGPRGDAIVEFDWSVGEILRTLKDCKLDQNTLILICSDNGPVLDDGYEDRAIEALGEHDPNGPYRGGKYNVYEGGVRTPMIAWWPAKIQPRVSDEVICTVDYPRTLAAIAGAAVPSEACPDSVDLSQLLLTSNARGRNNLVVQDNGQSGTYGYREGRWKLIRSDSQRTNNVELRLTPTKIPKYQLFDLEQDPGENNNVYQEQRQIAEAMIDRLQQVIQ
ncbi:MAG: sulfatase family protein [Pirellula sp.]|jgi:arylsulfatase A